MKILQVPEAKKIVQAYLDGYITVKELREELEQYWNMKTRKGTKAPVVEWKVFSVPKESFSELVWFVLFFMKAFSNCQQASSPREGEQAQWLHIGQLDKVTFRPFTEVQNLRTLVRILYASFVWLSLVELP